MEVAPMLRTALLALSLATATLAPPAAQATTLTFGTSFTFLGAGFSYSEGGYTFTGLGGSRFAIEEFGNPIASLIVGLNEPITPSDILSITRDDGGAFTLDRFDYASTDLNLSDAVTFLFFLDNVQVGSIADFFATTNVWTVGHVPAFFGTVDEIRLVGAIPGDTAMLIDNMVLTAIPAPPAAALLPLALAGLVVARRRA
jgi:hypothetical protein